MPEDGDLLPGLAEQFGDAPGGLAQIATAGLLEASIVSRGEIRRYEAPAASAREPMCITCSCVTSE